MQFRKRTTLKTLIIIALAIVATNCARAPIKSVDQAMRPAGIPGQLSDDLQLQNLADSLRANIEGLKNYGAPIEIMRFGPIEITRADYLTALETLAQTLDEDPTGQKFYQTLKDNYEFYEVYGDKNWGDVFITSYYEPIIQGRAKKNKTFTQPIYGWPQDMVLVDTSEFARVFPALEPYQRSVMEQKSRDGILRGRLFKNGDKTKVIPYHSRQEIDELKALKNQAPVICYVDPVDAFFLQIQGSGTIQLQDTQQEIRVGYLEQNGHPYKAIGRLLFDKIPKEQMTAQKIAAHLRSLPPGEAQKIMNQNPSYVFFQKMEKAPLAFFGTEAVPGRTIATDTKYFPKGAFAFLQYEKPTFNSADLASDAVQEWQKSSRFVLDQDTGGAIRGPHRVDLFWGRGPEAAQVSGVMRHPGRLYYILPKNKAL